MYNYDSNAILAEAIPNHQAKKWAFFFTFCNDYEVSKDLKSAFAKYEITFQCVYLHTFIAETQLSEQ